jgi:hypothetical protein
MHQAHRRVQVDERWLADHILLILNNFAAQFGPFRVTMNPAAGRALKPKGPG